MGLARLMGQRAPIAGLPPPNTKSWVARRKAAVVTAVCSGLITLEEACRHYQLSEEEFFAWQRAFETHGVQGLRATAFRNTGTCVPPDRPALYRQPRLQHREVLTDR
jgi:hypothetical protein